MADEGLDGLLSRHQDEIGSTRAALEKMLADSADRKIILVEPLSTSQRHGGITGLKDLIRLKRSLVCA